MDPYGRVCTHGSNIFRAQLSSPNAAGSHDLVATIDGREVVVTESLIRAQLQLDDANGIFDMQIDDIFAGMGAIGYPPDRSLLSYAPFVSSSWRFLVHTILHCLSPKAGSWNQFPSSIATTLVCLSDCTVRHTLLLSLSRFPLLGDSSPEGSLDEIGNPFIIGPPYWACQLYEPEDIDNLNFMEDDTILGGFHEETHAGPEDAPYTPPAVAVRTVKTQLRATTGWGGGGGDAPATEGDVDIQDEVDLEGLSRMASEALGHDQATVPSEDMEEREEEEFHAPRSADVLPQADISESAGPSGGAEKGKVHADLEIPLEFLAEELQAGNRSEEEKARRVEKELDETLAGMTTRTGCFDDARCTNPALALGVQAHNASFKRQRVERASSQPSTVPAATTPPADDHDSAGGSSFHPAGSAPPLSGSVAPTLAGGVFGVPDSTISISAAMDSAVHTIAIGIGMSRVAADPDSDDEVLAEILFRGQSISGNGVVIVDKLPDDEIVDPRVKDEPVSDYATFPPRSRRKHHGVRSDDSLWDKPVEDFFSSESESDDDIEDYIPPIPYGAFKDWEIDLLLLRRRMNRYFRLNPDVDVGLDLWRDVNLLCQSLHSDDVEDFWRTQDEWVVSSWKLYPRSSVHVVSPQAHSSTSYCRAVVVGGGLELIIQDVQAGLRESYECLASAPLKRKDVREVSNISKRSIREVSRRGRIKMGNEPILALPKGADDFVVYYDARSKDLEACLEKGEGDFLYVATTEDKVRTSIWRDVRTMAIEEAYTTKYSIYPGADTMLCSFRLTNRWLSMKKDIASGRWGLSFEYGCASFEAWYGKSEGYHFMGRNLKLWVVEGLTLERCILVEEFLSYGLRSFDKIWYLGGAGKFNINQNLREFFRYCNAVSRLNLGRDISMWGYCDKPDLGFGQT
ncbi:hypothetical protein Tco_1318515 [Tanacetum coccineum]